MLVKPSGKEGNDFIVDSILLLLLFFFLAFIADSTTRANLCFNVNFGRFEADPEPDWQASRGGWVSLILRGMTPLAGEFSTSVCNNLSRESNLLMMAACWVLREDSAVWSCRMALSTFCSRVGEEDGSSIGV